LGAETLLQLLKNYSRSSDIKKNISVGIIGFPNVGKSSLINSLKRSKAVSVGAKPGVTRTVTEVTLDKNITLIDCPGIIFASDMSQADAALRNCINFEQLEDATLPIQAILQRCPVALLSQIYKIPSFRDHIEFLHHVAVKRGKLRPGGIPDIELAAQVVFYDWNSGKIPYYTIPPESDFAASRLDATIVSEWSQAFNLRDIMDFESNTVLGELQNSSQNNEYVSVTSVPMQADQDWGNLLKEEENEDEEQDENISDETPIPKPKKSVGQTAIAPIKEKKEALPVKEKVSTEQLTNPTTNKDIRKSIKLDKKEDRKILRDIMKDEPAVVEDTYTFNADFWKMDSQ